MKILITGGAGFVGGNLAVYMSELGHDILCMDNLVRRGSEFNLQRFLKYQNIKFIHGDIRNTEDFDRLNFVPDVVLECSAQTTAVDGYDNPMYDITNNTIGLINVLEFCRKNNAGLIFWSTNKTYSGDLCNKPPIIENNTRFEWDTKSGFTMQGWSEYGFSEDVDLNGGNHTVYGVTKSASDLFCQEWASAFNIPVIINRFSCIYGTHQFGMVSQGWIVWFILAKHFGLDLTYFGFNGKQVRDCLHVNDVCSLIDKQVNNINKHHGSYYNVGGGHQNTTSVQELNEMLDNIMNTNTKISQKPPRLADQKIYISDIRKVSNDFNWFPKNKLKQSLYDIIDWVKQNEDDLLFLVKHRLKNK